MAFLVGNGCLDYTLGDSSYFPSRPKNLLRIDDEETGAHRQSIGRLDESVEDGEKLASITDPDDMLETTKAQKW